MVDRDKILYLLNETYHDMGTALNYQTPYQLLVAVILSAQSTDDRVNIVTKDLFELNGTPHTMLELNQTQLEDLIKSIGLYHTKSKNILAMTKILVERLKGELPNTLEELTELPGVGRKTANIILAEIFRKPAIAVDTHVFRVANRLGLAHANTPEKTELQLMENIPRSKWSASHHWLIWHGRKICHARKPECEICFLSDLCTYLHNNN